MTDASVTGRRTYGLVDGSGLYFSRAVAVDRLVFLSSPAVNEHGQLADEAKPLAEYHLSDSATVRAQATFIFDRYKEALNHFGSSIDDVLQVEQYVQRKTQADGYVETSRGPENMAHNRPGSALMQLGDQVPVECICLPTGIAVVPGDGWSKEIFTVGEQKIGGRPEFGKPYEEDVFSEVVTAGPYAFTVGDVASDFQTGIDPEGKAAEWAWWGNAMRKEAGYIFRILKGRLEKVGSSLANTVHSTAYFLDIGDLYELDQVWRDFIPEAPPARTIVPIEGQFIPRKEGVKKQEDGALQLETMFQSIVPGKGYEKQIISTGIEQLGYQSEAVKAGPLLWTSGILAADRNGLLAGPDTARQIAYIFDRLRDIAEEAGTTIENMIRLRAFVTDGRDGYAVYSKLREIFPSDPPTVAIGVTPGPLQIPGASIVIDAVVYCP